MREKETEQGQREWERFDKSTKGRSQEETGRNAELSFRD